MEFTQWKIATKGKTKNNGNINYIPDIVKFVTLSAHHLTNKHKTIPNIVVFFPFSSHFPKEQNGKISSVKTFAFCFYNCKGMNVVFSFYSSVVHWFIGRDLKIEHK